MNNEKIFKQIGGARLPLIQRVHIVNTDNRESKYPKVITFDGSDESFEKILKYVDLIVNIEYNQFTINTEEGIVTVIPGDKLIIYSKSKVKILQHEQ